MDQLYDLAVQELVDHGPIRSPTGQLYKTVCGFIYMEPGGNIPRENFDKSVHAWNILH